MIDPAIKPGKQMQEVGRIRINAFRLKLRPSFLGFVLMNEIGIGLKPFIPFHFINQPRKNAAATEIL